MSEVSERFEAHRNQDLIERLEKRLADGHQLIEDRRAAGIDVTELEKFWRDLLKQYCELCEETPS